MRTPQQKMDILLRLKRIEGQLRGLQRMVEEEVPCPEIMNQVAAATAAIKRVGMVMVQNYMEECLHNTQKEAGAKREERLRGLQTALSRYIDWA